VFPTAPKEQAAYCMEASFGYVQRLTRLLELLHGSHDKGKAMLGEQRLSATDKGQLQAEIAAVANNIAGSETEKKMWDSTTQVFVAYMQKNGLFTDSNLVKSMSGQVQKDQEAVQSNYRACLRTCAPNDPSCRKTCNETANSIDANRRMLHCADIVAGFK